MKLMTFILAAIVLLSGCSTMRTTDAWTKTDTAFESVLYLTSWVDMTQTLSFAEKGIKEDWMAPLIGSQPSRDKIIGLNVAGLSTHTLIAMKLNQPYRRLWQIFWIGVEATAVTCNAPLVGIALKLPW